MQKIIDEFKQILISKFQYIKQGVEGELYISELLSHIKRNNNYNKVKRMLYLSSRATLEKLNDDYLVKVWINFPFQTFKDYCKTDLIKNVQLTWTVFWYFNRQSCKYISIIIKKEELHQLPR